MASPFGVPLCLKKWLSDNESFLAPPVCNRLMFGHNGGFWKAMFVGGPNDRTDYHIEEAEEWFYQVKGDMCVKIVEQGKFKDVVIREGEMFLLPPRIPHSPQRYENTIGIVLERDRTMKEFDGLRWYCPDGRVLYEEWFHCEDLGTQLVPVINRFRNSEAFRTGEPQTEPQTPPFELDTTTIVHKPFSLKEYIDNHRAELAQGAVLLPFESSSVEFVVRVLGSGSSAVETRSKETFFYALEGSVTVKFSAADSTEAKSATVEAGQVLVVPGNTTVSTERSADAVALETFVA